MYCDEFKPQAPLWGPGPPAKGPGAPCARTVRATAAAMGGLGGIDCVEI